MACSEQKTRRPPPKQAGLSKQQSRLLTGMVTALHQQRIATKSLSSASDEPSRLFLKQHRVVGREKELSRLNEVYQRVSKARSELVLIHGASGVGKSTLLEAFVRELPSKVFYISGKFDQLQSHAPYAALVNAADQLCRQVLRGENSSAIRDRLRKLLGPEINLLGGLIPTIAKMTADGDASSNARVGCQGFTRFKLLFRAFLRCVASVKNPVALFLDDIQWADESSLEVLKALVTDGLSKHIMIIGSYREGEMGSDTLRRYHLSNEKPDTIDESTTSSLCELKAHVTDIKVTGLDVDSLNELIASTLGIKEEKTSLLSKLVLNKTDGNAFYVLNFLDMLVTKSLLLKSEDGSWSWDEKRILQETNVSDNLAAILETKVRGLSQEVHSILQLASFIGHTFTTEILVAIVHEEQDMIETEYTFEKHSREVIYERIIVTLKVALTEGLLETTPQTDEYKFSHDRVQQCLYSDLIPDEVERELLHQRIGLLIWKSMKHATNDVDNWVFLAAENLNRAVNLVDYSGTRCQLIEVNLKAAKLAMERSAFHSASEYLRVAMGILEGDSSWENHYDLCLDLYSTAAEAEKSIACYGRTRELVGEIHHRAKTFQQQLEAYTIEVDSLAVQGNLKGAIQLGLHVLRKLNVKFPKKISTVSVAKELALAKIAIGKRPLEELLKLPEMTDPNRLFALELMNIVAVHAFALGDSYKETYAAVCIRMVRMTVRYGLSVCSPMAFVAWGSVHSVLGQFDVAVRAQKLSLDIVDQFNAESIRARVVILNYGLNHLWRNALDASVRHEFLQAYHLAMSFGDISHAHVGFISWLVSGIYLDQSLDAINRRTRSVVAEGREYESTMLLIFLLPPWQVLLKLTGDPENPDPHCFMGEAYDDDLAVKMKTSNSKMAIYGLQMDELILAYTYEDWDVVQTNLPLIRKLEKEVEGYFCTGFNYSWNAVCHYELYLMTGKKKHKKEARRCHSKVTKWATTGTIMLSGANKWLAAIEALCMKKLPLDELEILFKEAFVALAANKNRYFEALATERLARLCLSADADGAKGQRYLERTIHLYRRWGALAKANWLEKRYSQSTIQTESWLR